MNPKFFTSIIILLFLSSLNLGSEDKIDLSIFGGYKFKGFQVSLTDSTENLETDRLFLKDEKYFHRTYNKNKRRTIWIKTKIKITGNIREFDNLILLFDNFSPAFQVFWDGKNIGNSGLISNDGEVERSGKIIHLINLKNEIVQKGTHILTIRLFFNPYTLDRRGGIFIGYKSIFTDWINKSKVERQYFVGFFIVLASICFFLFFTGQRNPSYLFFGIYTGIYSFTNLLSYWIFDDQISVELYRIASQFFVNNREMLGVILVLFLLWHFKVENKKHYIILLSFILFLTFFIKYAFLQYIEFYRYFFILPLHLISIYICFKSYLKKIPGSLIAFLSFLVFTIAGLLNYFIGGVNWFFPTNIRIFFLIWFYLTLLLSIIINIQARNKKAQEVLVRSKRLEAELLKKSIQPHFILNTLLSLKSLIVSGGNKAEKLIDSLADEFNLIREISSESKITLHRELELCRLHLKIMGFRRYAEYMLKTECKYPNSLIPPLVIHTLVENGITHSFKPEENGVFTFRCRKEESRLRIRIQNNGSLLEKRINATPGTVEEGTGIRYIKSRLQETYGRNWDLDYGISGDSWMVEITIPFEEKQ